MESHANRSRSYMAILLWDVTARAILDWSCTTCALPDERSKIECRSMMAVASQWHRTLPIATRPSPCPPQWHSFPHPRRLIQSSCHQPSRTPLSEGPCPDRPAGSAFGSRQQVRPGRNPNSLELQLPPHLLTLPSFHPSPWSALIDRVVDH